MEILTINITITASGIGIIIINQNLSGNKHSKTANYIKPYRRDIYKNMHSIFS